jgi:cytochrome d ubiquinol oxidase subunit II
MLYFVIFFLWISFLIYLLMGGADFGAGVLELIFYRKKRSLISGDSYHAIGPIWEANHMWLIIALVILFVGFPNVYSTVSVFLHIPIVIMLVGIIARGTSFTFRHYDAVNDHWQLFYNRIFAWSSFITPLFLGIIAGSVVSRSIDTGSTGFAAAYIYSWLNEFSLSTGLFTVALCGFLAAVYLFGETAEGSSQDRYRFQANIMSGAMLVCVLLVFISANRASIPLVEWIFGNWISRTAVIIAAIGFIGLQFGLKKKRITLTRLLAGCIVTLLLVAVTYAHFPNLVLLKDGRDLSLLDQSAPPATINVLGMALLLGGAIILPSLIYLVYSFHKKDAGPASE